MKPLTHEGWMTMGKFIAGGVAALFILTMVNCSGTLPTKTGGMTIVDHTPIQKESIAPCK